RTRPNGMPSADRWQSVLDAVAVLIPVRSDLLRRLYPRRLPRHLRIVRRVRRVAEAAVLLVALGPLEQRLDAEHRVVDTGVQVSEQREASRRGGDGEVRHLHVG